MPYRSFGHMECLAGQTCSQSIVTRSFLILSPPEGDLKPFKSPSTFLFHWAFRPSASLARRPAACRWSRSYTHLLNLCFDLPLHEGYNTKGPMAGGCGLNELGG
jgi:hypothetical protein